jgi:hypothetical protein
MSAIAAVTFLRLLHNSLTCFALNAHGLGQRGLGQPIGRMNSSLSISPTVAGLRFVVSMVHFTCNGGRQASFFG